MKSHKNEFSLLTSMHLVVQSWSEKYDRDTKSGVFQSISELSRRHHPVISLNMYTPAKNQHVVTQRSGRDMRAYSGPFRLPVGLKGVTETPLFSAERAGESKGQMQQLMLKEAAEIDKMSLHLTKDRALQCLEGHSST